MAEHGDIDGRLQIDFSPKKPKITINDFKNGHEIRRSNRERVTEHRLGDRIIKFHQQLNSYDCGPCLALNVLEIFKNKIGTVENIRQQINSCNEKEFQSNDRTWFESTAIERFFKKEGLWLDFYNVASNQIFKQRIDSEVQNKGEIFAFSGSNTHFSGYYLDKTNNVWQLDSFKEGPRSSSIYEMRSFLDNLGRNNSKARLGVIENRNNTQR